MLISNLKSSLINTQRFRRVASLGEPFRRICLPEANFGGRDVDRARNRLVPYFLRVAYKIFLCEGEGLFPLRAMEGP
jgi:hypothetical protein